MPNLTELEEIRDRVERKRRGRERERLIDELYGREEELDSNAIYLTVQELAKHVGCPDHIVRNAITSGQLPARKSRNANFRLVKNRRGVVMDGRCGYRHRWYIHPDDARHWAKKCFRIDLELG